MSLENLLKFLQANDLSQAKNIVLCHLSDANSNEELMRSKVYEATMVPTTIAVPGLEMKLELYPF